MLWWVTMRYGDYTVEEKNSGFDSMLKGLENKKYLEDVQLLFCKQFNYAHWPSWPPGL